MKYTVGTKVENKHSGKMYVIEQIVFERVIMHSIFNDRTLKTSIKQLNKAYNIVSTAPHCIVKYYSYKTGELIREAKWENITYNKIMTSLYSTEHKYIIGNSKDTIEVYV